jgi:DNA-binding transcriptional LysR family regulator
MEWNKIKYFYLVAEEGGFNKAARRINISQSTLSRAIDLLEHSLKTKLFIRNKDGVTLTKDGETFIRHARNMIIEAENAIASITMKKHEVGGSLKLAVPHGFATMSLFKHLIEFYKIYPDTKITLICEDEDLDLKIREADASIRTYAMDSDWLVQTYLTTRIQHLYASPVYLEMYGVPSTVEELDKHHFISFNNPHRPLPYGEIEWILKVGCEHTKKPPRNPVMVVNSVECLYQAAREGVGIIALSHDSDYLKRNELIRILPEYHSPETKMYFTYPEILKPIKLIKTLEEYLVNAYQASSMVVLT